MYVFGGGGDTVLLYPSYYVLGGDTVLLYPSYVCTWGGGGY